MFAPRHHVNTATVLVLALCPTAAFAHAAQGGFVLLLPTGVYTAAGVATVALTVIGVALIPAHALERLFTPLPLPDPPDATGARIVTSLLSLAALCGLLAIGFYGPRDPLSNLLPLTIWTLWWIGFVTAQGLFGDLWRWLNPWTGMHRLLWGNASPPLRLPQSLGHWPAVVAFLLVIGFALADPAPDDPARLAAFVMGYALVTLAGVMLFGPDAWLGRVECFTVLLRLFAHLAPVRRTGAGFPGWSALHAPAPTVSLAVFIIVLLGSGSFDGLNDTFWWLARIGINPLEFPGRSAVVVPTALGLLGANAALVAAFALCVATGILMVRATTPSAPAPGFSTAFAILSVSVLPIAFGYHVAHYLTAMLVNGQYAVAALTDPLADGSDFLGLGQFYVTTGFFNTRATVRTILLTQAGAIVLAHVLGVLMAHRAANRLFGPGRAALMSQIPLALFMVLYTLLGLWLLAAPRGA